MNTPFSPIDQNNSIGVRLDRELERSGWTARSLIFDEMVEALRGRNYPAFDAAKLRFNRQMKGQRK